MNIKGYVIKRLAEMLEAGGHIDDRRDLELIWREVRERFPHRCAEWTYILSIAKKHAAKSERK